MIPMTYAAALPVLQREWGMSAAAAGSVSSAFQVGYAVSMVVLSEVADRIGAKRVFLISSLASAVAALLFAGFARSYPTALFFYTLLALVHGGTYTPGIMLLAEHYPSERRGRAMGFFIAASSTGYAASLVVSGLALPVGGYRLSFLLTCLGPALGFVLIWLTLRRTHSSIKPRQVGQRFSAEVLRNKPAMLIIAGYTFHSWELLAMWVWTPAFITATLAVAGVELGQAAGWGAYLTSLFHLMGLVASSTSGSLSDAWGRTRVIMLMAGLSTACSFLFGWLIGGPVWLVLLVGLLYGFSALGDSPVYSTGTTELVEAPYLGAALALRSFLGFGAGAISPVVFGMILDWTNLAPPATGPRYAVWGWAFSSLGIVGAGAVWVTWVLRRMPEARCMAGGRR